MAYAFDTSGYAKRLRDAGVPQQVAEGHAEAAREFIMAELVTRADLEVSEQLTRSIVEMSRRELETAISTVRRELEAAITNLRHDVEGALERQTLRMTVRLGSMIGFAIAILAAIVKL